MNTARFIQMSMAVVVAAMLVITIVAPMVDSASKETTTITNEGAGDLRLTYYEEPADYTISASATASELTIGTQTIDADDMIIYAFDSGAVLYADGSYKLVADDGDVAAAVDLGASCVIEGTDEGTVSFNADYQFPYTWAYAPDAGGAFGFFTDSGATIKDFPVATAGSFAGVYAYNAMNSINYATMAPTYSVAGGVFTSGPWTVPDLGAKVVKEIKEIEEKEVAIKEIEEKEVAIKAVPTPTYTDGDWGFNLSGTNAIIVSYSGAAGDLSIPATVTTGGTSYSVTQIGIGSAGSPVFDNTVITGSTITIPDSVTSIGKYAFSGCSGFTGSLTIPGSVTSIGNSAFIGCSGFTGSLTILDSVTSIGNDAFSGCSGFTGSLTIPDSVTSIGGSAFNSCSGFTGSLTIPDSVTSIGNNAFIGCSGFTGSLTIPDSVISIGGGVFSGCSGFTGSLTIPDSVTSIGTNAFSGCSGFTGSLTIPDSVVTIAASAFKNCSGFTGPLVIPESVDMVESSAFQNCTGFTGIVMLASPSFGSYPFTNMTVDVLNLGTSSISPGQYGLAADAVIDDEIPSLGYIAPVNFSETVQKTGTLYTVMAMLPVLIVLGLLVGVASIFVSNRRA